MDVFEFDFYDRLRQDYKQHGSLFVAYDYDNTIFDYHGLGINYHSIIEILKESKELGFTMILFTGNEGDKLESILNKLKSLQIPYDFVNENPIMDTRKPYYNILLDDRAGLKESYNYLKNLIDEIRNQKI